MLFNHKTNDMNLIKNYGLHGFNGCQTENFKDASVTLLRISDSDSPSIYIGSLRPNNYRNSIRLIRKIRSQKK